MQMLSNVSKNSAEFHPQKHLSQHSKFCRIRRANQNDIEAISKLIRFYSMKGVMLSRDRASLAEDLENFFVAENEDDEIVGCGALRCWHGHSAEVRSLAVRSDCVGMGIGAQLVQMLALQAFRSGKSTLFALTLEPRFFEKMAFRVVERELFPQKIQTDCLQCRFQKGCQEIAVALNLGRD
jgi:amino-acid N-acetyltransferase